VLSVMSTFPLADDLMFTDCFAFEKQSVTVQYCDVTYEQHS
jgi:hypothetical protein